MMSRRKICGKGKADVKILRWKGADCLRVRKANVAQGKERRGEWRAGE